jgi:hypothetical protein
MYWVFKGVGCGFCFGIAAWFLWPFLLTVPNYRIIGAPVFILGLLIMVLKSISDWDEDVSKQGVLKIVIRLCMVASMMVASFNCGFCAGMLPIVLAFGVTAFS